MKIRNRATRRLLCAVFVATALAAPAQADDVADSCSLDLLGRPATDSAAARGACTATLGDPKDAQVATPSSLLARASALRPRVAQSGGAGGLAAQAVVAVEGEARALAATPDLGISADIWELTESHGKLAALKRRLEELEAIMSQPESRERLQQLIRWEAERRIEARVFADHPGKPITGVSVWSLDDALPVGEALHLWSPGVVVGTARVGWREWSPTPGTTPLAERDFGSCPSNRTPSQSHYEDISVEVPLTAAEKRQYLTGR